MRSLSELPMPWPELLLVRNRIGKRRRRRRLQRRREFARMKRIDAAVIGARQHQHRRIGRARHNMMIRRIGIERGELRGVRHRAELRDVERAVGIEFHAHHVVDADGRDHGMRELRMLRQHRAHQQSAVRAAEQRELRMRRVMLRDQIFARGREIVEHVLLFGEHAFLVPAFAIFLAAPDIGDGVDAAGIEPEPPGRAEKRRRLADAVAAITVEQRGIPAVELRGFFHDHIDGNFRAVLRGRENARHFKASEKSMGEVTFSAVSSAFPVAAIPAREIDAAADRYAH
jgi:hypothetical protein